MQGRVRNPSLSTPITSDKLFRYTPFPILFPVKCVCPWPLTECNGKCGIYKACPSKGHSKRDLSAALAKCPVGQTVCGILGRAAGSWECINTKSDLESCEYNNPTSSSAR